MELNAEIINSILEISESYELPQKLMNILLDEERRCLVFEQFLNLNNDLSYDWFTNYFQEGVSNRKKFMQDFTPKSLTKLIPELLPKYESCLDVCAGTGGLTIGVWSKNSNAYFCCEELSGQAFPLLLFNMAIRNMEGQAVNKNVLTGEIIAVYKLFPGKHFSNIIKVDEPEIRQYDICITNPPYSLKWEPNESVHDERFHEYFYPPKSKADYAFILHGLYYLKDGGVLCGVLPFGVLFRGQKESAIRQKLITNGSLKAVIGLPDKLFLNTAIPVCLMFLQKHSSPEPVLIIDASKEFEKNGKQNILTDTNHKKICEVYYSKKSVDKFASVIKEAELEKNEYNLNISRYVENWEREPVPDVVETSRELLKIEQEIKKTQKEIYQSMIELEGMPWQAVEYWRQIAGIKRKEFTDGQGLFEKIDQCG